MTDDVVDLIITELADSEHRLARDLVAVRQLLRLALELAHEKERQLKRLGVQHSRLRHEYRRLRETILHDDRADGNPGRRGRSILSDEHLLATGSTAASGADLSRRRHGLPRSQSSGLHTQAKGQELVLTRFRGRVWTWVSSALP